MPKNNIIEAQDCSPQQVYTRNDVIQTRQDIAPSQSKKRKRRKKRSKVKVASWYKLSQIQKKKFMDFKGYPVYYVNDLEIRNICLEDEEFTDFAIHYNFPDLIPENEIWVSEEVNKDELMLFLNNAAKQYNLIKDGYDPDEAYEKAIKYEKSLREKIKNSESYYSPSQPEAKKLSDNVHIQRYGVITDEDITVWIVNGKEVRDAYKTDYVEGGHGYVYDWIPNDEIWIDNDTKDEERMAILTHEYTELKLMRDKNMEYEQAHHLASIEEYKFREGKENIWFIVSKE